eukprot:scaffold10084_cov139-Isochrysis_galbana.AAC.11
MVADALRSGAASHRLRGAVATVLLLGVDLAHERRHLEHTLLSDLQQGAPVRLCFARSRPEGSERAAHSRQSGIAWAVPCTEKELYRVGSSTLTLLLSRRRSTARESAAAAT